MLRDMQKKILSRVNIQTRHDMFDLPFIEWVRCFRIATGTRGQIAKLLYDRFSIIMVLLRLVYKIWPNMSK